jgi:dTDP-4-dehydrorhamnose 3,5-epimerase
VIFTETPLRGAFLVDLNPAADERGFFARTFCMQEFAAHGLTAPVSQCSVSFNEKKGTLRGLHFQSPPHEEEKLVRCTSGGIFDAIVDLRPESITHHQWFGVHLTAENHRAIYVPKGFAHGFLSLVEHTEVLYMISVPYAPGSARGLRWDDPALGISWPMTPSAISTRDAEFPLLAAHGA